MWPHLNPQKIVYVECDPETAYNRVLERGGVEGGRVTLGYLERLHEFHDEWLGRGNPRVIRVNTSSVEEADMVRLAKDLADMLLLPPPLPPRSQIFRVDE